MKDELLKLIPFLESLKIEHYFCEDGWYSCPKAEGGCLNEHISDGCNCGADEHNKSIDNKIKTIEGVLNDKT